MQAHSGSVVKLALSRVSSASYHQQQAERATCQQGKSKVACLTLCWRLQLSHIHTCLNRTSHLERKPLAAHAYIAFIWVALTSSRRPPPALPSITSQASLVLVDGWGRGPAPSKPPPLPSHWHSPRPSSALDLVNQSLSSLSPVSPGAPTLPSRPSLSLGRGHARYGYSACR